MFVAKQTEAVIKRTFALDLDHYWGCVWFRILSFDYMPFAATDAARVGLALMASQACLNTEANMSFVTICPRSSIWYCCNGWPCIDGLPSLPEHRSKHEFCHHLPQIIHLVLLQWLALHWWPPKPAWTPKQTWVLSPFAPDHPSGIAAMVGLALMASQACLNTEANMSFVTICPRSSIWYCCNGWPCIDGLPSLPEHRSKHEFCHHLPQIIHLVLLQWLALHWWPPKPAWTPKQTWVLSPFAPDHPSGIAAMVGLALMASQACLNTEANMSFVTICPRSSIWYCWTHFPQADLKADKTGTSRSAEVHEKNETEAIEDDIILVAKFSCLQGQVAGKAVNKMYHRLLDFLTVKYNFVRLVLCVCVCGTWVTVHMTFNTKLYINGIGFMVSRPPYCHKEK